MKFIDEMRTQLQTQDVRRIVPELVYNDLSAHQSVAIAPDSGISQPNRILDFKEDAESDCRIHVRNSPKHVPFYKKDFCHATFALELTPSTFVFFLCVSRGYSTDSVMRSFGAENQIFALKMND